MEVEDVVIKNHQVFSSDEQIVEHLKNSYNRAASQISNLSDGSFVSAGILNYFGMSGRLTRHLLNNIANIDGLKYSEVGTYHGSTLFSALYRNSIQAVCCDNWTQFGGSKLEFSRNIQSYFSFKSAPQSLRVIEGDFGDEKIINLHEWSNTDFYLFDGPHDEKSQYDGLVKYINNMSERFIFMVDDWHWSEVRGGTQRAIRDLGLNVLTSIEIDVEEEQFDDKNRVRNRFQNSAWHNGIALFACRR